MIPNSRTQVHINRYVEEVVKANGSWVYVSRAKHSKNVQSFIVDQVKMILELMGLKIEVDPYAKCRMRITA
ncbi:hypothetical protein Axy10_020 [Achromobacter phage vB_AxyP_19-32_Axy10]|uniref:Uncharacterized protein n=1 Tax=Achromobacter phage vB_AxyP_19-32_Axy10 TaxID=2591041 RepID=A0A514CU29_9CAUD|nr:hypothetical protein KMC59_gp20 [Achromobacter phage vB_AxyP_19-32_Axy10]QDH83982.1 hypothetical protein Axy10_020 [Achromobacter phage vB_AxyP_19-32_Axy10]